MYAFFILLLLLIFSWILVISCIESSTIQEEYKATCSHEKHNIASQVFLNTWEFYYSLPLLPIKYENKVPNKIPKSFFTVQSLTIMGLLLKALVWLNKQTDISSQIILSSCLPIFQNSD